MKCNQEGCEKEATHRFYWSDGPHESCEEHARGASALGNVMGLYVRVESLQPSSN